jgi:succinate dehydrogenase / fumarate reductase membrane anchor subunit
MAQHQDSIRSPLAKAQGLGSAKSGVAHWWMLRISSVPLIPLFLYFLSEMEGLTSREQTNFIVWIEKPLNSLAIIIFIVCSFYHACLGIQEVIEDYIPSTGYKIAALLLNKMFFGGLGVACLYAVLYINFGLNG